MDTTAPDDPWDDRDRRNQRVVGHLNNAQFKYTDEHGNDATNSLAGGAAWARTHLAALNSKMPADDFAGVRGYHVRHPSSLSGPTKDTVALYHPSSRTMQFGMAFPTTSKYPDVENDRRNAFRRAFVHEHGHHLDNTTQGAMMPNTVGHLEARAENYADRYTSRHVTGYDTAAHEGRTEYFQNHTDPQGHQSMQDYKDVRAAGDMPSDPRRVRDRSGRLQRPTPKMMPKRRA